MIVVLDEALLRVRGRPRLSERAHRFSRARAAGGAADLLQGARAGRPAHRLPGVMDPELVEYIDRVRQPYNVSSVAQAAAIAALEDDTHVDRSRKMVRAGMAQLEAGFTKLGLSFVPSQANFIVVRVPGEGERVQAELKKRGVLVRRDGRLRHAERRSVDRRHRGHERSRARAARRGFTAMSKATGDKKPHS